MSSYSYSSHSQGKVNLIASLKTSDKTTFLRLQELIFEEQNRRELSLGSDRSFISDRGPDLLAYVCLKKGPEAASSLATTPAASARKSLVVVLCPLATPTDDGFSRMVQDAQEQEEFVTRVLCQQLQKHRVPYIYIDKTRRKERACILERAIKGKT